MMDRRVDCIVTYHETREPPPHEAKMTQNMDLLLLTLGCEVMTLHTLYFDMTDVSDQTYERLRKAAKAHVAKISRAEWDSGVIGTRRSAFYPLRGRLEWAARQAGHDNVSNEIAFRRLFGLRATKRLRRDIARELLPSDARRATAMFDLLDQRGPMTSRFVTLPSAVDRANGELEANAFIREKLRKASFKGDILNPMSLSDNEIEGYDKDEAKIVEMYRRGVPCHEICLKVYPTFHVLTNPHDKGRRASKIVRVLKRLGIKLRTPHERRMVGNPGFLRGMRVRRDRKKKLLRHRGKVRDGLSDKQQAKGTRR